MKPRLAIVVNRFPVVSETFIFNKVKGLYEAGINISVFVQQAQNDLHLFQSRIDKSILKRIHFTPLAKGKVYALFLLLKYTLKAPKKNINLFVKAKSLYPQFNRALRAWVLALPFSSGYDIVHFEYSGLAVEYLDALPLLSPATLVVSCRGAAEQIVPVVYPDRKEKLRQVFQQVTKIHCVSKDMVDTVLMYGASREQTFVNYPSIDPEQFKRTYPYSINHKSPIQLLSVGRLHWKKGYDYALMALSSLLDEGYDFEYEICGGGPEEERIKFMIHELGLTDNVFLRGSQPAEYIRKALETADIFLLPSISEGLSNAVLEAMAMELPVISTTAGGMKEAIQDGVEGVLVPPGQVLPIIEKIKILIHEENLRIKLGQAGRIRVEKDFNLCRQIEVFLQHYISN